MVLTEDKYKPYLITIFSFFKKIVKTGVNVQITLYISDSISVISIRLSDKKDKNNNGSGIRILEKVTKDEALDMGGVGEFFKGNDGLKNIQFGGTNLFKSKGCITIVKENIDDLWTQNAAKKDLLRLFEK